MIDNRLSDTRVELVKGTAVVECDDPMKENSVTMVYGDYQVHVRKSSVMELVSSPAGLKVFHGEAEVELNGTISDVKSGKMLPFTQALAQEKFDVKADGDDLTRWSQERSEAVAVANVSAAKSLRDSGGSIGSLGMMGTGLYGNGIYGSGMPYGSWYYNPFYSMYTYIPMNGMFYNPYGYGFFSPYTVYQVYSNPGYYNSGGGSTTGTPTSSVNRAHSGFGAVSTTRSAFSGNSGRAGFSGATATPVSTYSPIASPLGVNGGSSSGMSSGPSSSGGSRSGGRSK